MLFLLFIDYCRKKYPHQMLSMKSLFPKATRINDRKFYIKFMEHNTRNVLVLSYLALLFFLVCISMDTIRYFEGNDFEDPLYRVLLILHFCLFLFFIPIVYLNNRRKNNAKTKIPYSLVYLWFFGSVIVLFGISVVSLVARNNLITFAVIILAYNGLYLLPIKKRLLFNGVIFTFMVGFALIRDVDLFTMTSNIVEITGLCILAVIFGNNGFIAFINQVKLDAIKEQETQGLKELDRIKNRYFANISHEFRTPLSVIKGLANEIKEPRVKEIIKRNANKTLNLINQILDLAKLENREMNLKMHLDDIIPYIHFLKESIHPLAEAKNIELKITTQMESLEMDYSPYAIQVILNNLMSNAIKFSPATSVIDLEVRRQEDLLFISVKDQGPGLDEEERQRVFDRFYSSEEQIKSGSGIGLSLVSEILDQLNGEISVSSEKGKGSTFQIQLPILQNAVREELALEESLGKEFSGTGKFENTDDSYLLIVEDNEDLRNIYSKQLSDYYRLRICNNGKEALEILEQEKPKLIISDVVMPEMTGLELNTQLLNNESTKNIPLIFISSKVESELQPESMKKGKRAFLQKPFSMEEIHETIEKVLLQPDRLQKEEDSKSEYPEENQFLKDVFTVIEDNMHQEDFGIVQLCFNLNISRTQLYRKLKEVSGKSASELIREKRIQKATNLILLTDKTVNEICYELGFKDPSYFSKIFKQVTGELPSSYKKRHKKM